MLGDYVYKVLSAYSGLNNNYQKFMSPEPKMWTHLKTGSCTYKRKQKERHRGKGHMKRETEMAMSQGTLMIARKYQNLRGRHWKKFLFTFPEGTNPADTLIWNSGLKNCEKEFCVLF